MESSALTPSVSSTPLTPSPSPKRKRSADHYHDFSSSPTRLKTNLPTRSFEVTPPGQTSPRTTVSVQLQSLNLHSTIPVLDFGRQFEGSVPTFLGSAAPTSSISPAKDVGTFPSSQTAAPDRGTFPSIGTILGARPSLHPSNGSAPTSTPMMRTQSDQPVSSRPSPPSTPRLEPVEPTTPSNDVISPLSSSPPPNAKAAAPASPPHLVIDDPTVTGTDAPNPSTSAATSRPKSPPPPSSDAAPSDLVWTADEITGHDPTDPADDGRGINGIGFRPTAALAAKRALARRRQVLEWKAREARDARQRRAERRAVMGGGDGLSMSGSRGGVVGGERKVRFADG